MDNGQAQSLYRRVVASVQDHAIFALDPSGSIMMWNGGAERLTGYAEAEAVGQPYTMLGAQMDEDELAGMLVTASTDGCFQRERWWRRRDAGLIWVEEQISPLEGGGYAVIAHDLTGRVEAEERRLTEQEAAEAGRGRERALRAELQAAERRASFLAEASSILVATSLDFESTVRALARLAVSRLADWCVIHAMTPAGALERVQVAHRDPRNESLLENAVDETLGENWERPVRNVLQTGHAQILDRPSLRSWFREAPEPLFGGAPDGSAMITPLLGRGTVLGSITFVATGPNRYDEEDLALADELGRRAAIALDNARLYREAQEANRAKADFLAIISHELRTPLNAIMGYADLLDGGVSGSLTDRQRRQIGRIRGSARHLLQLIEEILSFARMESGGLALQPTAADAREVAREAAAVIEPLALDRAIEFRANVDGPALPFTTDPGKLRQVLVNLLSNAVKFTEHGHVELRVSSVGDDVVYEVIDTGVGIPAADLDRIFQPFWQAERPNTRRVGGTGLGLSVSQRYVRLLGGEIEIDSEPGRGTNARVILPRSGPRS